MYRTVKISNLTDPIKEFVATRFFKKKQLESNKFAILAHPRSGSTTLISILKLHEDVNAIHEPFNKTRASWGCQYLDDVKDKKSFLEVIYKIYAEHDGFKHLLCQLPREYNLELINRVPKIIFLYRKNLLKAAISSSIAEQTKIWQSNQEAKQLIRTTEFVDISLDNIETKIRKISQELEFYKNYIREHNINVYYLHYEVFFESKATGDDRFKKLQEICNYLAIANTRDSFAEEVDALLNPGITKLNNAETYKRIPNIEVIERTFGDEYGHLFD